jgi:pyruvate dehydrogenase E1 component beta subunit
MKAAIRDNNPVIFIEHKALYGMEGVVPAEEYLVPIGQADIKRLGKDVTLIASGYMLHSALKAAETLAASGIDAEVIDPRTLKPLDEETLYTSVRKTHRVVLVQEACRTAGIAAEWGMLIQENCFDWLDAPIVRLAGEDVPIPYASSLESVIWPTPERIVQAVQDVCYYPGD